jgi:hypothetical protein
MKSPSAQLDFCVCSSRDALLVSSTLSSPTGLLFVQSPISVKISKRSDSALPNKRIFHFDLTSGWPHAFGTQFSNQIVRVMRHRDEQGGEGERRGAIPELPGSSVILR